MEDHTELQRHVLMVYPTNNWPELQSNQTYKWIIEEMQRQASTLKEKKIHTIQALNCTEGYCFCTLTFTSFKGLPKLQDRISILVDKVWSRYMEAMKPQWYYILIDGHMIQDALLWSHISAYGSHFSGDWQWEQHAIYRNMRDCNCQFGTAWRQHNFFNHNRL